MRERERGRRRKRMKMVRRGGGQRKESEWMKYFKVSHQTRCQEKALIEVLLQEIWNSFAVRPECYEVFISNSEITWAKQRDKSFEQVENPRIGHSEWNRKEWNTMSETGLDDGDRDQMMETEYTWWRRGLKGRRQGPDDGGRKQVMG